MSIIKKINPPTPPDSGDEATTKRVHDHIYNEKDVITTDDIQNAKTTDLAKPEIVNDNDEGLEKKIRDNEGNDIDTSWNVLEGE